MTGLTEVIKAAMMIRMQQALGTISTVLVIVIVA